MPLGGQWIVHGNSCWVGNDSGLALCCEQPA
jgi:hypothetical protein